MTSPSSLLKLLNDVNAFCDILSTFSEMLSYFLTVSFKYVPGVFSDRCPIPVSSDCSGDVMALVHSLPV